MRVLVTGASGFVGRRVCAELIGRGHSVICSRRPSEPNEAAADGPLAKGDWVSLDLLNPSSVAQVAKWRPDAVVHLAAQASGSEARRDPVGTWAVNVVGTVALVTELERAGLVIPFVFASTGEVYGPGHSRPIRENAPIWPVSPYAASKAAAEVGLMEAYARWGLPVVLARCFAQAGPGQRSDFVIPAWSSRLMQALSSKAANVSVGSLAPVREFVDVRDVARGLALLLERGSAGQAYNVAAGNACSLAEVFEMLRREVGVTARAVPDPRLFRTADIAYLVGDGSRLASLGWSPHFSLAETLRDVVAELRNEPLLP